MENENRNLFEDSAEKHKKELKRLTGSIEELLENMRDEYEEKIQELTERCEVSEQENIELKYKLKQLSEELKTLGEKIVSEVIKRTSILPEGFNSDKNEEKY